jgi:hypothetical protein
LQIPPEVGLNSPPEADTNFLYGWCKFPPRLVQIPTEAGANSHCGGS